MHQIPVYREPSIPMRLRRFAAVLLPFAFTACLEGTDYSTNPYPNIPIEETTFASSLNVNLAASTKTATGLYYRDLTVGGGATATSTSTISVSFAGYFSNGAKFDEATTPSTPAPLANFITGWQEGIPGMKAGGIRQLIVPPSLAYGATGASGQNTAGQPIQIPPYAVLVFTVTLVSVQ